MPEVLGDLVARRVAAAPRHAVPIEPLRDADELAKDVAQVTEARAVVEDARGPTRLHDVDVHAEMQLLRPLEVAEQVAVVIRFVVEHLGGKRPGHPEKQDGDPPRLRMDFMVEI